MTVAKSPQFKSLEEYLAADPANLPEGRHEYWDGELVPVMSESIGNINIASYLFALLIQAGFPPQMIGLGQVEVVVPGNPKTRYPDFTVLDAAHTVLLSKKATITRDMPPPRLLAEVVSPGNENSENYRRDYADKVRQYAAIGVPEYWLIDPERSVIAIGILVGGMYQFQEFRGNQPIVSDTFPEFHLTAQQILIAGR
jgi:Uma2 family endonuclease